METNEFRLPLPAEVLPLIVAAAEASGWQAKVDDGAGNLIDNPERAHERVFSAFLRWLAPQAANHLSAKRYNDLRSQTVQEVDQMVSAWEQAMKSN